MIVLIFLVGSLSGLLLGALLCVRFVRQAVTADLSPKLRRIEGQLSNIETELTYVASVRYAELTAQQSHDTRRQLP